MSEYLFGNVEDRRMPEKLSNEKLLDFLFLQVRNLWRVDGARDGDSWFFQGHILQPAE